MSDNSEEIETLTCHTNFLFISPAMQNMIYYAFSMLKISTVHKLLFSPPRKIV